MEWLTTKIEYDGLPLYLRLPNYDDVWEYQSKYSKLVNITHELDSVTNNGLPTTEYNESLHDFDNEVIHLFEPKNNGVLVLVETFGGARNYWFYTTNSKFFCKQFEELQNKHCDKKLKLHHQNDPDWGFVKAYPVKLYETK